MARDFLKTSTTLYRSIIVGDFRNYRLLNVFRTTYFGWPARQVAEERERGGVAFGMGLVSPAIRHSLVSRANIEASAHRRELGTV